MVYDNQIIDTNSPTLRVGVVGYGHLGQFLVDKHLKPGPGLGVVLGFVWNRNPDKLKGSVPPELVLDDLSFFANRRFDVIIEVCHPQIVKDFRLEFLSKSHFMEELDFCERLRVLCFNRQQTDDVGMDR